MSAPPSPASGELASLVERLNDHARDCELLDMPEGRPSLIRVAASQLSAVAAERDALREALKPFAEAADTADRLVGHDGPLGQYIAYDVLCAARSTLSPGGSNGQG